VPLSRLSALRRRRSAPYRELPVPEQLTCSKRASAAPAGPHCVSGASGSRPSAAAGRRSTADRSSRPRRGT
jgi:hypothetical protein